MVAEHDERSIPGRKAPERHQELGGAGGIQVGRGRFIPAKDRPQSPPPLLASVARRPGALRTRMRLPKVWAFTEPAYRAQGHTWSHNRRHAGPGLPRHTGGRWGSASWTGPPRNGSNAPGVPARTRRCSSLSGRPRPRWRSFGRRSRSVHGAPSGRSACIGHWRPTRARACGADSLKRNGERSGAGDSCDWLLRWVRPGRGGPTRSGWYQITRSLCPSL